MGLADKSAAFYATNLQSKFKRETKDRWMRCKVLVIDEISMIDGEFFEKLEEVARLIRRWVNSQALSFSARLYPKNYQKNPQK